MICFAKKGMISLSLLLSWILSVQSSNAQGQSFCDHAATVRSCVKSDIGDKLSGVSILVLSNGAAECSSSAGTVKLAADEYCLAQTTQSTPSYISISTGDDRVSAELSCAVQSGGQANLAFAQSMVELGYNAVSGESFDAPEFPDESKVAFFRFRCIPLDNVR